MIKIVKAVMKLFEDSPNYFLPHAIFRERLRAAGKTGPNSRERVREKIVVVLNGREIKQ